MMRAWAATGIAAALAGILVLTAIWPEPAEPIHGDKTLRQWLKARGSGNIRGLTDDSQTAIRGLGTNALPYLVSMASTRDIAVPERRGHCVNGWVSRRNQCVS